jgi:hypothetical protein
MKEPDFARDYAEARRKALEHAIGRLQQGAGRAVTTLLKKLRSGNDAVAVAAARAILAEAVRGGDLLDVLPRPEALEEARRREGGQR